MEDKIIEKELSYKLVGLFFSIQEELGRFCREKQYGDSLEKKLKDSGIEFQREYPIPVGDKKSNFVDFIICNRILVDLKAKPFIKKEDYFQMKRYLKASNLELGLVVNFRDEYIKPKRVLNKQNRDSFADLDKKFVASNRAKGFTIVELLVSMTLFITVIAISAGSFIQILRAQRMMVSLISANNNAVLTLEEISREIRTGRDFEKNGEELRFANARGENVSYRLNSDNRVLEKKTDTGEFKKLTADDVLVSRFSSIIFEGDAERDFLPRITVLISVGASGLPFETPIINLQSSISARNFE